MPETILTLQDQECSLHATVDQDVTDAMIGALSADPETMVEFQTALSRFMHPAVPAGRFSQWSPGAGKPTAAQRACIISLPARLLVTSWEHPLDQGVGAAPYIDVDGPSQQQFAYHLRDDWTLSHDLPGWSSPSGPRNTQRQPSRIDRRRILYGDPLLEFIVDECLQAVCAHGLRFSQSDVDDVKQGQARYDNVLYLAAREIHQRWLTTPLAESHERTPRDVMLAERLHIDLDIEHRATQWTIQGLCPLGLRESDSAYRWGGLGTHELVLYYDLLRHLLHDCLARLLDEPAPTPSTEVKRLRELRDEWLVTAQETSPAGQSPDSVMQLERKRLPLVVTEQDDVLDCDCPLCRMMATSAFGPSFWHLDESHFDDDFVFSLCTTRDEWESERVAWDDDEGWDRALSAVDAPEAEAIVEVKSSGVWSNTMFQTTLTESSPSLRLFGIGAYLAELITDLKQLGEARERIDELNGQYDQLCQTVRRGQSEAWSPVVQYIGNRLDDVILARPQLKAKCEDLQRHLRQLLE